MKKLPPMIDMRRSSSEDDGLAYSGGSDYPYGLSICLENQELEKLGLDPEECEVGDMLHIHGLAKVTSVSKNDRGDGGSYRVELTLTHIIDESEDEENEESEKNMRPAPRRLYK